MSDQLQTLLQRVYDEGVNKAKSEAEAILEKAASEAAAVVQTAKDEAASIVAQAQKQAADIARNSDSDLKLAAQHTLSAVKQKLTDIFLDKAFDAPTNASLKDAEFLKQLLLQIASGWKESGGKVIIAQDMEAKLDDHFRQSLQKAAQNGLKVEFSPQMKSGFALSPADGSYKLSFSDEDFVNLFKSYLRPRSNQLLFQD